MVWWESQLERDFLCLADIDPDVLRIRRYLPEEKVAYRIGDRWHKYTSDFWVERTKGMQVVEVKPAKQARKEKYIVLFRAVRPIFKAQGFEFRVALDEDIRKQPRLENVKLLRRYSRAKLTVDYQAACAEYLEDNKQVRLGEAVSSLGQKGISPQAVYGMLWHEVLDVDIEQPITKNSLVWFGSLNPNLTENRPWPG